jgi:hypothetical protein
MRHHQWHYWSLILRLRKCEDTPLCIFWLRSLLRSACQLTPFSFATTMLRFLSSSLLVRECLRSVVRFLVFLIIVAVSMQLFLHRCCWLIFQLVTLSLWVLASIWKAGSWDEYFADADLSNLVSTCLFLILSRHPKLPNHVISLEVHEAAIDSCERSLPCFILSL